MSRKMIAALGLLIALLIFAFSGCSSDLVVDPSTSSIEGGSLNHPIKRNTTVVFVAGAASSTLEIFSCIREIEFRHVDLGRLDYPVLSYQEIQPRGETKIFHSDIVVGGYDRVRVEFDEDDCPELPGLSIQIKSPNVNLDDNFNMTYDVSFEVIEGANTTVYIGFPSEVIENPPSSNPSQSWLENVLEQNRTAYTSTSY